MSALGQIIRDALSVPDDWYSANGARHFITHKPSGLNLWVGNGPFFFTFWDLPENAECKLGYIERHILWRRAKPMVEKFRTEAILKALGVVAGRLEANAEVAK